MNIESKIAILSITENGKELAKKIRKNIVNADIYVTSKIYEDNLKIIDKKMKNFVKDIFLEYDYIIFIMATGIVVRSIAPYIIDKTMDPAVIVIDEKGKNVISLLSGHIGGANEMAIHISKAINANPVITTATDVNEKSSLDMVAKSLNAYIEDFKENVKKVNYKLVHNEKVGIYIDGDYKIDSRGFSLINDLKQIDNFKTIVYISNKKSIGIQHNDIIKVIPKDIVLGIGCRRNTDGDEMYKSLLDLLDTYNIDINAIKKIGSVEVKKDEKAIIDLAEKLNVKFDIISIEEILKVEEKFSKSEFVKKTIGVYSVSEPVAYILSKNELIAEKIKYKGITFSIGRETI